jgi:AbrB family looped-hinge helix DNA binding protein
MKTTVSSKGQIVLPAEFRQMDRIEPGQEFDIERIERGIIAWFVELLRGTKGS